MSGYNVYFNYVEPHVPRWLHRLLRGIWRRLDHGRHFASYLPAGLRRRAAGALESLRTRLFLWRIRPLPTRWLGPRWRRKGDLAQLDITYSCNLKCYNCNRSCEQDPSNDGMSLGQVRQFLEESRANRIQWRNIDLLGGEPTNHPQFLEIVNLLLEYRDKYFPRTRIVVWTNGYGERVNRMLSLLPPGIEVENTAKSTKVQSAFHTFNVAPVDVPGYAGADFSNACSVVTTCGAGVTPYGYYPCAVAGAIDRTFGLNLARKEMPKPGDPMTKELRAFCALCGLFKPPTGEQLNGPVMSPTWVQAYARSRQDPPKLSRLPEAAELVQIGPGNGQPHSSELHPSLKQA
ncbi:MAG: radical SAM protein [Terriglobia bacterium]